MADATVTSLEIINVDEPTNPELPLVVDDISLAFRLGFRSRTMWWLMLKPGAAYKAFQIPKASGGVRQIHAPTPSMRVLLKNFRHRFLLPVVKEMGPHVTAYRIGQGAVDAAKLHVHECSVCAEYDVPHTCCISYEEKETGSYRLVKSDGCKACSQPPVHERCGRRGVKVHLDLKDFFSNTRAAWIREYLREEVGYNERVAGHMASLMTTPLTLERKNGPIKVRGVPQGAPTSGDICNLVAQSRLDVPVLRLLEGTEWRYSRYADDIYLSHPENLPREAVSGIIDMIRTCVNDAGWRLNNKKIQVQRPKKQQRLLGVSINRVPNIPNQEYRRIRVILHRCWHDGFVEVGKRYGKTASQMYYWLNGKLSWFSSINPTKTKRLKLVLDAAREKHGTDTSAEIHQGNATDGTASGRAGV